MRTNPNFQKGDIPMPKIITDKEIGKYMDTIKDGKTQKQAAAKIGISVRRARDIENGKRVLKPKTERRRNERSNPVDEIFETYVVPYLKEDNYQATFLFRHIQRMFPGKYSDTLLRTFRRRVGEWEELYKPPQDKEVMFPQEHKPGVLMAADFSHPKDKVVVTIKKKPFKYIFFHVRLAYSGLSYAEVFEGSGEAFEKFAQGLNNGLEYWGGVPKELRTDSLSAAFKNLNREAKEDLTRHYEALTNHYGLEAKRINKGKGHENGSIESPHGHLKEYLRQSLAIRGSNDFDSLEEYQAFVLEAMDQRNLHLNKALVKAERIALKPLPSAKALEYKEATARVSSASMIQVKKSIYSVPNHLIGETLLIRLYGDKLECYLGRRYIITLDRVYPTSNKAGRNINPKHLVGWLVRKPQAFRNYKYQDDLLSNPQFKYIWEYLDRTLEEREACKIMTRLLYLAYKHDCVEELTDSVIDRIHKNTKINIKSLENKFIPKQKELTSVEVLQHALGSYNELIGQGSQL